MSSVMLSWNAAVCPLTADCVSGATAYEAKLIGRGPASQEAAAEKANRAQRRQHEKGEGNFGGTPSSAVHASGSAGGRRGRAGERGPHCHAPTSWSSRRQ